MDIILASQSPRRQELMHLLTSSFQVKPSDFDESQISEELPVADYCQLLAKKKAQVIAKDDPTAYVIGSDTVVYCQGRILNKPRDRQDAQQMMEALSGRSHEVYTAYAILNDSLGIEKIGCEVVKVHFSQLSSHEIKVYLDSEDYLDKAGAYAIQGEAAKFIEKIEGDVYAVIGLPVHRLYKDLKELNVSL